MRSEEIMSLDFMKGRERGTECVCRLSEGKRERDKVCVCVLCEEKRERNRLSVYMWTI